MLSDDTVLFLSFSHLNFEFVSNFVLRISDLVKPQITIIAATIFYILFVGRNTSCSRLFH